jgi:hypothetical protein
MPHQAKHHHQLDISECPFVLPSLLLVGDRSPFQGYSQNYLEMEAGCALLEILTGIIIPMSGIQSTQAAVQTSGISSISTRLGIFYLPIPQKSLSSNRTKGSQKK